MVMQWALIDKYWVEDEVWSSIEKIWIIYTCRPTYKILIQMSNVCIVSAILVMNLDVYHFSHHCYQNRV